MPGLARDRLRGGVGEAVAGEDGRGGREQPRALAVLPDLERRRVAAPRCCLLLPHGPSMVVGGSTLWPACAPCSARSRSSSPSRSPAAAQAASSASDFKGDKKDVADTIEQLQTSASGRKPEDICSDLLARSLVEKLKTSGSDCVDEMEKVTGDADDFELDVKDVTITGTTATANVEGAQGRQGRRRRTTFALVREDGKWRLTDLGPSYVPPAVGQRRARRPALLEREVDVWVASASVRRRGDAGAARRSCWDGAPADDLDAARQQDGAQPHPRRRRPRGAGRDRATSC